MKAPIKKIKNVLPVTVTKAVYIDGTGKTLDDVIKSGELFGIGSLDVARTILGNQIDNLIEYRGLFDIREYRKTTFRTNVTKGDWWIYKDTDMQNVDCSVLYQNGIVYFDGTYFRTIYIPYQNTIIPKPHYDVVVVGSGAGGIGAAYALKDSGWNVALIEQLDTLGGTHCNGVGLYIASPICPWFKSLADRWHADGIITATGHPSNGQGGNTLGVGPGTDWDKAYRATQYIDAEKTQNGFYGNHLANNDYKLAQAYYNDLKDSMDIFINTSLVRANSCENGGKRKITDIDVKNTVTGKEFRLTADYFIDCSGDGVLYTSDPGLTLGTDYFIGADPKNRFNETILSDGDPGDPDFINTVEPIYYRAATYAVPRDGVPPLATRYKKYDGLHEKPNFSHMPIGSSSGIASVSNSTGTKMSVKDFIHKSPEWNYGDGYNRALCMFTNGSYTAGNRFAGLRKILAIREKYRVAAEKTVTSDWLGLKITSANYRQENIIALSTWWVDFHNKGTYLVSKIPNGVPYEAMIPKAYDNVLVACRGAGFSHIGLASVRLVKTIMDMGHAAGLAIKQMLDNESRGDIRSIDVEALQDEMQIAGVISELETHFIRPAVNFEIITL